MYGEEGMVLGTINADTMLFVGVLLSLGAGALSFLSPCVLPIFPAYLSYITGISVKELQGEATKKIRRTLLQHAFFFLLGVSLVFVSLGIGASFLGQWIQKALVGDTSVLIQQIAGVFIIVMGLFVAGWLNIPFLMKERRKQYRKTGVSFLSTFFVGTGFAAGWTPCIGPIFGSILLLAASEPTYGVIYTFAYVIGFAIPFLVLTFFIGSTKWIVQKSQIIMKVGGVLMIVMGMVLFTGQMTRISLFLLELVEDTWLSKLG